MFLAVKQLAEVGRTKLQQKVNTAVVLEVAMHRDDEGMRRQVLEGMQLA